MFSIDGAGIVLSWVGDRGVTESSLNLIELGAKLLSGLKVEIDLIGLSLF